MSAWFKDESGFVAPGKYLGEYQQQCRIEDPNAKKMCLNASSSDRSMPNACRAYICNLCVLYCPLYKEGCERVVSDARRRRLSI